MLFTSGSQLSAVATELVASFVSVARDDVSVSILFDGVLPVLLGAAEYVNLKSKCNVLQYHSTYCSIQKQCDRFLMGTKRSQLREKQKDGMFC